VFLYKKKTNKVGPLSQANRAAACISFDKNISAKSVHLTSLYSTELTSTNDDFTVLRHYVCVSKVSK